MDYPRGITQIHQIEVTTRCNLTCKYCPHPKMKRPKEDMEWSTFLKAMELVKQFSDKGTQGELSFTGIGESTMHPRFPEMLRLARMMLPHNDIVFSTNGLPTFTEHVAQTCKENGIGVFISLHRPEVAGKTLELCKKYGIARQINTSAATSSFDWAGQVDWFVSAPKIACAYLRDGWGVILFNGKITSCCIDSEEKGVIGDVDTPFSELMIQPYELCKSCHMEVP